MALKTLALGGTCILLFAAQSVYAQDAMSLDQALKRASKDRMEAALTFHENHVYGNEEQELGGELLGANATEEEKRSISNVKKTKKIKASSNDEENEEFDLD